VNSFLAALQFLLLTPAFIRRTFTPQEMGKAVGFYPLVGLLLGAILAIVDILLGFIFPIQVRSALILALWVVLTGGLHLDGFLDACDGLLGGSTPERRMEIMRDERVGAFALAGGVLLLLIFFASLNVSMSARWAALLLAPLLGRWAISLALVMYPYARPSGLGRDIKDHAGRTELMLATLTSAAAALLAAIVAHSLAPVLALIVAFGVFWLSARFILQRIPGMTGDTYGAIDMLVEAGVLLAFVAMR
jgi:adenosylcobinamide-GDP ribazoletransferase